MTSLNPKTVVEPIQLWCWKCPLCCEAKIMDTVASSKVDTVVFTCFKCDAQFDVRLPEDVP